MEKSIGSLWINTGKNGEYWTGNIDLPDGTKQNVIVFKNTYKKDKQPDLKIYKKQQKQEENFVPNDEEVIPVDELPF